MRRNDVLTHQLCVDQVTDLTGNMASDRSSLDRQETDTGREEDYRWRGWVGFKSRGCKRIRLDIGKSSRVEFMQWMFVVLMSSDKLKGKCNGEKVEIMFNLHDHISFGLNSLGGGEVMTGLVEFEFGDEALTVKMDGQLTMMNQSRIVGHGKVKIQKN